MEISWDAEPKSYRVTYVQSSRRRTRNVGVSEFDWLCSAWHCGIRVTSYRKIGV